MTHDYYKQCKINKLQRISENIPMEYGAYSIGIEGVDGISVNANDLFNDNFPATDNQYSRSAGVLCCTALQVKGRIWAAS